MKEVKGKEKISHLRHEVYIPNSSFTANPYTNTNSPTYNNVFAYRFINNRYLMDPVRRTGTNVI